jgi:ubiquinone/menaquinone biosynthesis C-methylase UbiE
MRTVDRIKRVLRAVANSNQPSATAISAGYKVLEEGERPALNGWQDAAVAERQHQAFMPLLQELRSGHPRLDFVVAAQAVSASKLTNPLLVEVGCGSGYYSEALPSLLARPITYLGVDYSECMTGLARRLYPAVPFVTADACRLPFEENCCDILLSGTSLMHIADYRTAIAESVRVSRSWCIFHTVPVMSERPTTLLTKEAYGEEVIEVIFNRSEMETMFDEYGLVPEAVFESIPYDVSAVVGERTWTLTYLCRKR